MEHKFLVFLFISFFIIFILVLLKIGVLNVAKSDQKLPELPDIPTITPPSTEEEPLGDDPNVAELPQAPSDKSFVTPNRETSSSAALDDPSDQSSVPPPEEKPSEPVPEPSPSPRRKPHPRSSLLLNKPMLSFLKKMISEDDSIEKFDNKIISKYQIGSENVPEQFKNWETNSSALSRLCNFGFQVLQLYETYQVRTDCSEIADDIVIKIGNRCKSVVNFKTEWDQEAYWVDFAVDLTRFLAAYECIGDDDSLKTSVCHPLVIRIITGIDKFLGASIPRTIFLFYAAMTRIVSNYLFDERTYRQETKRIKADPSILTIPITINETNDIQDGLYQDLSCITYGNVANYDYIQQFREKPYPFYENICRIFSLEKAVNLVQLADEIFLKMCHPVCPQMPMGMFDHQSYTVGDHWRPKYGKYGIHIFPFMGLGVFKSPLAMFSVRVQRPRMAVCRLDKNDSWNIALGCVQLRKLYLANQSYQTSMSWANLVKQPGVISGLDTESFKDMVPSYDNESFYCENVNEKNLIGLWHNPDMLFWRQTYGILNLYTVREFGVVTVSGLALMYSIHNLSDKMLRICVKDNVLASDEAFKVWTEPGADPEGFISCEPGKETSVYWKMLLDEDQDFEIQSADLTLDSVSFKYNYKDYEIKSLKNTNYLVTCDGTIMGGSSRSKRSDKFIYGGLQYVRTPSLMYKPKN